MTNKQFAMSVDVEDFFQVWAFSDIIQKKDWDGYQRRVADNTHRILDIFDVASIKATFFTLGWIAEREPALIKEIVARGHELASHGYDHEKVFEQTAPIFKEDITKAKQILEDISGEAVIGYRAPGFSLDKRTPFAHAILAEAGYRYSSSSHPIAHDHYGDPHAPRVPHQPEGNAPIIEAPVATLNMLGKRISAAGGGWFRAAPYPVGKALIARAARQLQGPVIFYFHPWELDPDQPRIASASRKSKLRHYLNLQRMDRKISLLSHAYSWTRIDRVLELEITVPHQSVA